ncbi:MAG: ABC transporter permease [Marinisporobacter sp.]|jgi:ABC-type polysaccharide/polyol phosphate export permease|nr:ABC transporter permease [Marinisporobacter sp.]
MDIFQKKLGKITGSAIMHPLLYLIAFGYYAAILIKSHYQINWFKTYINTPMTFLCGTFFSLEKMPSIVKGIIEILPLTHASRSLRAIALNGQVGMTAIGALIMYLIVFYFLSVYASF